MTTVPNDVPNKITLKKFGHGGPMATNLGGEDRRIKRLRIDFYKPEIYIFKARHINNQGI